jgi:hypothetical protein
VAHDLYTPEQAARSTLAALRYLSVLPRTVRQDFSQEFVPGRGTTVNVKGPITVGEARTYTQAARAARTAITFDDLDQVTYPVTLEDQVYKAVRLPDDFATFTLEQLEQEVLKPQAESVVKGVTNPLLTVMQGVSPDSAVPAVAANGSNARAVLIALRRVLNSREVPVDGRFVAVGPGIEAAILNDEVLQKANEAGTDAMLRMATIGNLFGFTIVADPLLPDYYGVAYNRDAFAHVTRPSRNPEGAAKSATIAQDGFALRWLQHYNPQQLEDQSVVDTFVGAMILDPERAVSFSAALEGTTITITDDSQTIAIGEEFALEVKDSAGTVIPNRLIAWTTSNAGRATVSADGVVTGVATGTAATITATFQTKTDTASIVVS